MPEEEKRTRAGIVFLKTAATVMVVFIHSFNIWGYAGQTPDRLSEALFAVTKCAVPLFMAVSGFLLFRKPVSFRENVRKKVRTLLIPYLIWNTAWILFEAVGYRIAGDRFENVFGWSVKQWITAVTGGIPFSGQTP